MITLDEAIETLQELKCIAAEGGDTLIYFKEGDRVYTVDCIYTNADKQIEILGGIL